MKQFYTCDNCQQVVFLLGKDKTCQHDDLEELKAYTHQEKGEKHQPVVSVEKDHVFVNVGEVMHPMEQSHHIEWIFLETKHGSQIKYLKKEDEPKAEFILIDDQPQAVYSYCNQHGLWYQPIK